MSLGEIRLKSSKDKLLKRLRLEDKVRRLKIKSRIKTRDSSLNKQYNLVLRNQECKCKQCKWFSLNLIIKFDKDLKTIDRLLCQRCADAYI